MRINEEKLFCSEKHIELFIKLMVFKKYAQKVLQIS